MTSSWRQVVVVLCLLGCGHEEPFAYAPPELGPRGTGPDILLTFNAEQDYWPIWTADGRGILYSFVLSGISPQHRCVGLLPAAGGSRVWQLCDDRFVQRDSVNSFTAYALGANGRLLYSEVISSAGTFQSIPVATLWLADSAAPFERTALLTLPVNASTTTVNWLADIAWTGPASFIALGQTFQTFPHCKTCSPQDSLFADSVGAPGARIGSGVVVTSTMGSRPVVLQAVSGTDGATGYSLAENGASIVFTRRDDARLFKVPVSGGTPTVVATVSPGTGTQLVGVSCKASTCVVAADPLTLSYGGTIVGGPIFSGLNPGPRQLLGVSLASGAITTLDTTLSIIATPQISPTSHDVVVQIGGLWGHLQTVSSAASDLHLLPGIAP